MGPGICSWLAQHGGPLADVPCTMFPGFWAAAAPRSAIIDLIQQRVVAPETYARPLSWYTRLLYGLGISSRAEPLLDEAEHMSDPALLGIAASHVQAVSNWTVDMARRGVPPSERADRHLLLIEVSTGVCGVGACVWRCRPWMVQAVQYTSWVTRSRPHPCVCGPQPAHFRTMSVAAPCWMPP